MQAGSVSVYPQVLGSLSGSRKSVETCKALADCHIPGIATPLKPSVCRVNKWRVREEERPDVRSTGHVRHSEVGSLDAGSQLWFLEVSR